MPKPLRKHQGLILNNADVDVAKQLPEVLQNEIKFKPLS